MSAPNEAPSNTESGEINPSPAETPPAGTAPASELNTRSAHYWRRRAEVGLALTLTGFLVFLIGARPSMFTMDRSPIIGFVQIAVFLVGLAVICIGGYVSLMSLWGGRP